MLLYLPKLHLRGVPVSYFVLSSMECEMEQNICNATSFFNFFVCYIALGSINL